jgi:hypothetical protein
VTDHLAHAALIGGAAVAFVIFVVVDIRRHGTPWRVRRGPSER